MDLQSALDIHSLDSYYIIIKCLAVHANLHIPTQDQVTYYIFTKWVGIHIYLLGVRQLVKLLKNQRHN